MEKDTRGWSLSIGLAAVLPVFLGLILVWISASHTGGQLTYFMDDAYIHMGIAKNYILNGSFGINETRWTSLTSSPLYSFLLIGLLKLSGMSDQVLWPLAMAAWVGLAWTMGLAFKWFGYSVRTYCVYIGLLAVCLPISYVFLHGMEHILHVWFTSLLLILWHGREGRTAHLGLIALCAALASFTRFETFFLTGTLAAMDLLEGRYKRMIVLGILTVVPPLAFMAWMQSHGADFVPASVSVKSTLNTASVITVAHDLFVRVTRNLASVDKFWLFAGSLAVVLPTAWSWLKDGDRRVRPLLAACVCIIAGMLTTPMDFTFRYEMWLFGLLTLGIILYSESFSQKEIQWAALLALPALATLFHAEYKRELLILYGVLVLIVAVPSFLYLRGNTGRKAWLLPLAGVLLIGSINRFALTLPQSVLLGSNVYGQQQTFARFLKTYYDGKAVVLNDIGTTAFFTQCPIIDRAGLATQEMVPAVKRYNQGFKVGFGEALDSVARLKDARLAIVYSDWMKGILPQRWIPVATMRTPSVGNLLGDELVNFYAFSPSEAAEMRRQLNAFRSQVPAKTILTILPE